MNNELNVCAYRRTYLLLDIDECAELSDVCHGGECKNTFGSFVCVCPAGHHLDVRRRMCVG